MTHHIEQGRDDKNDTNTEGCTADGFLNDTKSANDDQAEEHPEETSHVDGSSTDSGEEEPTDDTANEVTTR